MPARTAAREFAKGVIDQAIRETIGPLRGSSRRSFADLLWNVQHRSDLLRPGRFARRVESEAVRLVLRGLVALLEFRKGWRRPVEAWEPRGSRALAVFTSLAHHLMADYPVPPVLHSAWFLGTDWHAQQRQRWFIHCGMGRSLREAGLPIRLGKRMAHEFADAPGHFSIEFALRWAQVRGLGGSDDLAVAVASSRLGSDFDEDEFWTSVILLFLNEPRVTADQVAVIIDYLHDRKFEYRRAIIGEGTEIQLEPPEPDLSIKGRTVASLMRRVEAWRAERRPDGPERRLIRWGRSGLNEFRRDGDGGVAWTIRELLDSDELAAEGVDMHHCVATYTENCAKGRSTIWSLGAEGPEGRRRLLTIEVSPADRRVVQASMKCNEGPDESCMTILKEWAGREGLEVEA